MVTSQRVGLAVAILYSAVALYIMIQERSQPGGFLANMGTFLVTAPISFPLSAAGLEPKVGNLNTALALILANAALFYRVSSSLAGLFLAPAASTR